MPFVKFEDLTKSVNDFFKKEFFEAKKDTPNFQLEVKNDVPVNGLKLTSNSSLQKFETDKPFAHKLSLEWQGPSGFKVDKFEFNPSSASSVAVETSVTDFGVPGLKLEFKGNNTSQSDLSFHYEHAHATITGSVDASDFGQYSATVSSGVDDIAFGASSKFAKGQSPEIDVSATYTAPKIFAGLAVTEAFKAFKGLFSFAVDNTITVAATPSYNLDKSAFALNLGAVYKCNADTTIKTKFDLEKNLDLSVKQSINKGLTVAGWANVSKGDFKSCNYGVKLVLG